MLSATAEEEQRHVTKDAEVETSLAASPKECAEERVGTNAVNDRIKSKRRLPEEQETPKKLSRHSGGSEAEEADKAEADKAEAGRTEANRTEAGRTEADKAEAGRTEAGRTEADKAEAGRTEPVNVQQHPPPSSTIYLGGINGPGGKVYGSAMSKLTVGDICDFITAMSICKQPLRAIRLMPAKACCFIDFMDAEDALEFFRKCYGGSEDPHDFYHMRRITNIAGVELRVGWAPPTLKDVDSASLRLAIKNGATRCVFMHPVEDGSEGLLRAVFKPFEPLDSIKIVAEKNIAFVHLASIQSAMHAVATLSATKKWKRVSFGTDRAARTADGKRREEHAQRPPPSGKESCKAKVENRTVFLGGLPPKCTLADLCAVIRAGGPILSIRTAQGAAFVTFVEGSAAQCLYDFADRHGVVVHGKRLTVGWGKPSANSSGPLSPAMLALLRQGATRILCVASLDALDAHQLNYHAVVAGEQPAAARRHITNEIYYEALERYFVANGYTLESVNIVHGAQRTAFINFASIADATRALEQLRKDDRFDACRLSYGKDRCAQPLPTSSASAPKPVVSGGVYYEDPFAYAAAALLPMAAVPSAGPVFAYHHPATPSPGIHPLQQQFYIHPPSSPYVLYPIPPAIYPPQFSAHQQHSGSAGSNSSGTPSKPIQQHPHHPSRFQ